MRLQVGRLEGDLGQEQTSRLLLTAVVAYLRRMLHRSAGVLPAALPRENPMHLIDLSLLS